ncbi:S24 family peptidase [Sulfurimonas sp.]|uniref:S24 family peptidase n=1 Tax=Sulfurimonas sp. TaxID=2022749 RepID=UPI002623294F|nr:S24 family peptidase [Sulfurimonas sp.]MCW8894440.1 S24 family peptidase [Sulfurimonas sp.]
MSLVILEYVDVLGGKNEKKVLKFSMDLLPESVNKESLFVIKVDGKSMQPVIKDRALVVADLSQRVVQDQGIYLVYQNNSMWIKQAKQENTGMTFVSINKAFSHLVYNEVEVRVVAKVVLSFSTF